MNSCKNFQCFLKRDLSSCCEHTREFLFLYLKGKFPSYKEGIFEYFITCFPLGLCYEHSTTAWAVKAIKTSIFYTTLTDLKNKKNDSPWLRFPWHFAPLLEFWKILSIFANFSPIYITKIKILLEYSGFYSLLKSFSPLSLFRNGEIIIAFFYTKIILEISWWRWSSFFRIKYICCGLDWSFRFSSYGQIFLVVFLALNKTTQKNCVFQFLLVLFLPWI